MGSTVLRTSEEVKCWGAWDTICMYHYTEEGSTQKSTWKDKENIASLSIQPALQVSKGNFGGKSRNWWNLVYSSPETQLSVQYESWNAYYSCYKLSDRILVFLLVATSVIINCKYNYNTLKGDSKEEEEKKTLNSTAVTSLPGLKPHSLPKTE